MGTTPQINAVPEDANKACFIRRLKPNFRAETSALMAGAFNEQLCRGLSVYQQRRKLYNTKFQKLIMQIDKTQFPYRT